MRSKRRKSTWTAEGKSAVPFSGVEDTLGESRLVGKSMSSLLIWLNLKFLEAFEMSNSQLDKQVKGLEEEFLLKVLM